jgi:DNA-binding response OmpR family regulator
MKILLIDECASTIKQIVSYFISPKYNVTISQTADEAFDFISEEYFDIYILNTQLSGASAQEIIRYIKEYDTHTPIILILNNNCAKTFKLVLKHGCNDLIIKPFIAEELEIRIKNIFKKSRHKIIQIDENTYYDLLSEELYIDHKCVRLRKKERRFLTLLLQNINQNVSLETIYNYVWEGEVKNSYPLRQLVSDIRKLLKPSKNHLIPITGNGYKFEL